MPHYSDAVATAKTPAQSWIQAGLRALADGGPDAVRVEALAASLGVSKGGFYWHFSGRDDLLTRMLDTWEQTVVDDVIEYVEGRGGDARARLRRLFGLALAATDIPESLGAELAIRDWARRDPAVAVRLRGLDERRMAYMRGLYGQLTEDPIDVEARALETYALLVGGYFIAAQHGDLSRAEVVQRAFERLLA